MLPCNDPVAYRDDRQALELQVRDLERENERLKEELQDTKARARARRARGRDRQKKTTEGRCPSCGGSLLPAAVFAGKDRNPQLLRMSTLRFGDPSGGFTSSAPIRAKVCASCGFIFPFIDIASDETANVTGEWTMVAAGITEPESDSPADSGSREVASESGSHRQPKDNAEDE